MAVAIVLAGFVVAALVYSVGAPVEMVEEDASPVPAVAGISSVEVDSFIVDTDLQLGDSNASVTIIEYADFECEDCRDWHQQVFPDLKARFIDSGVVHYVHRDFPLQQIHDQSFAAARAARCAAEQDLFWGYAKALYGADDLSSESFTALADTSGLDRSIWAECVETNRQDTVIGEQSQEAIRIGVTATPAFVINGHLYEGALSIEQFSALISQAMAR